MAFSPNSAFMYAVAVLVILFVLAQSAFFLVRAYRRALQLGISCEKLKKTIVSTAVFTIAPAISFLLGVVTLSKFLGIPLPWIRLSVVGALTYELPAATSTANALAVISPVLNTPAMKPAFDNILPALFGGLAVVYVSKNWKLSLVPLVFMVALFTAVPSLAGSVVVLVPVGVLIALGAARIMYTKG